jgi:hypothetical protein
VKVVTDDPDGRPLISSAGCLAVTAIAVVMVLVLAVTVYGFYIS